MQVSSKIKIAANYFRSNNLSIIWTEPGNLQALQSSMQLSCQGIKAQFAIHHNGLFCFSLHRNVI